jgi:hypothetical protein
LLRDHQSGLRNNGAILWALLSLELWARAYASESTHAPDQTAQPRESLLEVGA